jgi:preprotein translocase subunit SecD
MKLSDLNPFNKLRKKEVKMSENELTLEALQEGLSKEIEAREALEAKVEQNSAQLSSESSEGKQPKEVEQLKGRIAELEQAEPSLKQQGAEEFVKSFEVNKVEDNELAQRIFSAIRGAGYDIVSKEQLAEAAGEAETEEGKDGGTPEPPYLHIIDHPEEGYFPWTEGRFAKIVEAV